MSFSRPAFPFGVVRVVSFFVNAWGIREISRALRQSVVNA